MSDKYKLIILPEAQTDIRNIIFYITSELASPQAAMRLQSIFKDTINSLADFPKRIKLVDEQPWREAGVRRIRVKNYYIYFVIVEEEHAVKIMAVIYTRRDQEKQMDMRNREEGE